MLSWGELQDLKAVSEVWHGYYQFGKQLITEPEFTQLQQNAEMQSKRLSEGEVVWEALLGRQTREGKRVRQYFELPELPVPFTISFLLEEENAGNWQRFKEGDRVRFIGRFADITYSDGPSFVMSIRFPDKPTLRR